MGQESGSLMILKISLEMYSALEAFAPWLWGNVHPLTVCTVGLLSLAGCNLQGLEVGKWRK
jgi:hypothetical protein